MPKVDIIIRAKDGHDLTTRCVQSIVKNTPAGTYRIIRVDDGSREILDPVAGEITVRSPESSGAVTATNMGLAVSLQYESPYVIVMDNDTEVPEGDTDWLERFVAELEEHDDTAAIGATTSFANKPQHILAVPQTYTANWKDDAKKTSGQKDNPPVVWFVSFCVLMRKAAVRQLGFWDERFNPGNWEDTDYAMQMRVAGMRVRVARSVYVHHRGHKTFGDNLKNLLAVNKRKFIEKWGPGRLWDMGLLNHNDIEKLAQESIRRSADGSH